MKRVKISDEEVMEIVRLFPDHTCKEVAEMVGIGASTVWKYADSMGLEHTEEFNEAVRSRKRLAAINNYSSSEEANRKRSESVKAVVERDRKRIRLGLKPISGREYNPEPLPFNVYGIICRIAKKYGYIKFRCDNTLYYNAETNRINRKRGRQATEKYYREKYGFVFQPLESRGYVYHQPKVSASSGWSYTF